MTQPQVAMNTNGCTPFISLRLNGQTNCARSVDAFVAVAEIDEGAGFGVSFNVLTSCRMVMVASALGVSRIVDGIVNGPSTTLYAHKFSLRPQTKSCQVNTPTTHLYYIASQVHMQQWVPATVSWKVHSKTTWHGSDSPCLLVLPILFTMVSYAFVRTVLESTFALVFTRSLRSGMLPPSLPMSCTLWLRVKRR